MMKVFSTLTTGILLFSYANADSRPVEKAWGKDASISECFATPTSFGLNSGGRSRSDIALLVNTETMSFSHRITAIKVCELPPAAQTSRSLI